jgi:hypothetical protein
VVTFRDHCRKLNGHLQQWLHKKLITLSKQEQEPGKRTKKDGTDECGQYLLYR